MVLHYVGEQAVSTAGGLVATGQEFHDRGKRLDDMIPALRAMWRPGWVEYHGPVYDVPPNMPSATDLYFPVTDAKYEAQFMSTGTLLPIPSVWGHPAEAGANPEDRAFLNDNIGKFLSGQKIIPP